MLRTFQTPLVILIFITVSDHCQNLLDDPRSTSMVLGLLFVRGPHFQTSIFLTPFVQCRCNVIICSYTVMRERLQQVLGQGG